MTVESEPDRQQGKMLPGKCCDGWKVVEGEGDPTRELLEDNGKEH